MRFSEKEEVVGSNPTRSTMNSLICGDCLDIMPMLPKSSVDLILADLPYGVTSRAKWDVPIDLDRFWEAVHHAVKPNTAVILTAVQPFASLLILSNMKEFRYDLVWRKNKATGHLNAKIAPLRSHELILVFYRERAVYNPQKTEGHKPVNAHTKLPYTGEVYGQTNKTIKGGGQTDRYPTSVLNFPVVNGDSADRIHSTQKSVALFEWLIRTYSNPGDLVLDPCIGSGTTAIAAINTDRQWLGIEKDLEMALKANKRINSYRERSSTVRALIS